MTDTRVGQARNREFPPGERLLPSEKKRGDPWLRSAHHRRMTEPYSIYDPQRAAPRPARPWRPYLWGLASCLKIGGIAAAFYLAWRAGLPGTLALAAFLSGSLLRRMLEVTSAGD